MNTVENLLPEVAKLFTENGWGEHPNFTREEWRGEIADGSTQRGYWSWVNHRVEIHSERNFC